MLLEVFAATAEFDIFVLAIEASLHTLVPSLKPKARPVSFHHRSLVFGWLFSCRGGTTCLLRGFFSAYAVGVLVRCRWDGDLQHQWSYSQEWGVCRRV